MSECLEEIIKGDKILRIYIEDSPQDPRCLDYTDGNAGFMVCFHNNYNLGDLVPGLNKNSFDNWEELGECLVKDFKAINLMPLYLLDHSGISISTTPFNCNWDSGQIGFIYTTKERIKELGIPKKYIEKSLIGEVKIYNDYLEGSVYGYDLIKNVEVTIKKTYSKNRIEEYKTTEEEDADSCWGFYGEEGIKQIKEDTGFLE